MTERRCFHAVFGLREQTEPFHVLHYLSLASCLAVNRPRELRFHYRHEPYGPWWDRIRSRITRVPIGAAPSGFAPQRYAETAEGRLIESLGLAYAHESDFLRLDILRDEGGVYADMDTLFVRPYPDAWFDHECVIGEENAPFARGEMIRPTLCNAMLMAKPGARFIAQWRERMAHSFDGTWNRHSCDEAARIWQALPDAVRVLPSAYCYAFGASLTGVRALLENDVPVTPDVYSVHLWAHLWWTASRTDFSTVHAGEIDEPWLRTRDRTLARIARQFL